MESVELICTKLNLVLSNKWFMEISSQEFNLVNISDVFT